ncbi:MAG: dihydrofolate reductase family protein [Gammaproteobacteria bacterium]|jgi:riboflavin biosynthesis pyrimidine reductase|nr:dihydrofolate reductase family protein [Gammaproteobacteria bacterium]
MMSSRPVTRLFPTPSEELPLASLYLDSDRQLGKHRSCPCVYTNFVTSLDGRIAIEHADKNSHQVPDTIANQRDWRLYQELAAQADVLVTSARYFRQLSKGRAQDVLPLSMESEFADLHEWRRRQGLPPQPAVAILTSSLNLPLHTLDEIKDRPVYVVVGEQADASAVKRISRSGVKILFAGKHKKVEGAPLVDVLVRLGFGRIYSIAGPGVLETLLAAGVLDRLYLTQVHRLIGGQLFDTLLEGGPVSPPADFRLGALYYDAGGDDQAAQFFCIFENPGR